MSKSQINKGGQETLEREHHDQRQRDIKKHGARGGYRHFHIENINGEIGNGGKCDSKDGNNVTFYAKLSILRFIPLSVKIVNKLGVQLDGHCKWSN